MRVECVFFGPLRERVGTKTVVRDTDAATVHALLRELEATYPGLDGRLLATGETGGDGHGARPRTSTDPRQRSPRAAGPRTAAAQAQHRDGKKKGNEDS